MQCEEAQKYLGLVPTDLTRAIRASVIAHTLNCVKCRTIVDEGAEKERLSHPEISINEVIKTAELITDRDCKDKEYFDVVDKALKQKGGEAS